MYSLVKFEKLDELESAHVFQFSQWMKGSGVPPDEVFSVCKLVVEKQPELLSVYCVVRVLDGKVIGYLAFFLGLESMKYSRINFFAINPQLRGRGLGKEVLDFALNELMMPGDITTVACEPKLRAFYESCGFEYAGQASNSDELLYYSEFEIDDFESLKDIPLALVGYDGSFRQRYAQLEAALKKK